MRGDAGLYNEAGSFEYHHLHLVKCFPYISTFVGVLVRPACDRRALEHAHEA